MGAGKDQQGDDHRKDELQACLEAGQEGERVRTHHTHSPGTTKTQQLSVYVRKCMASNVDKGS